MWPAWGLGVWHCSDSLLPPSLPQASSPHRSVGPAAIARNLISLLDGASLGELTSLEEMIVLLMKGGHLTPAVVHVLWEIFAGQGPDTSRDSQRSAALVLSMAAAADHQLVKRNLNLLIQRGLGGVALGGPADLILARHTCVALQKLGAATGKKDAKNGPPFRLPTNHPLFERLSTILTEHFATASSSLWCPLAEQATSTIYLLSEQPDLTCGRLLKSLTRAVFEQERERKESMEVDCKPVLLPAHGGCGFALASPARLLDSLSSSTTGAAAPPSPSSPSPFLLSRLLHMVGQVAQCQLVHLEVAIASELKRRRAAGAGGEGRGQASTSKGKTPAKTPRKVRFCTVPPGTCESACGFTQLLPCQPHGLPMSHGHRHGNSPVHPDD